MEGSCNSGVGWVNAALGTGQAGGAQGSPAAGLLEPGEHWPTAHSTARPAAGGRCRPISDAYPFLWVAVFVFPFPRSSDKHSRARQYPGRC